MHNVVSKILLIIVVVLIGLFAYKTIKTPNAVSTTVSINTTDQQPLDKKLEVEQIVKEYLLNNPEIVIQAVENFQQRKMQEMEDKTNNYIKDNKSEIENSLTSPSSGNQNGDVIIVTFYDYSCSYCKKGNNFINKLIESDPNVKVIWKPFPILSDISNYAASVALAVYRTTPEKFTNVHDGLMHLTPITKESVEKLLLEKDLNPEIITAEINKGEVKDLIDINRKLALDLKIQGVPAYIINGRLVAGMLDLENLQKIIIEYRQRNK